MNRYRSVLLTLCFAAIAASQNSARGPATDFRFVSWGDTKEGLSVLISQSNQAKAMNPNLTIYNGDLVNGFSLSGLVTWKDAMNGNAHNGMFDKTFAVRGNHDKGNDARWQEFFNFRGVASAVGAKNYGFLSDNLTYSFDYNNSHFIGVDDLGDVTVMTEDQINWMDQDLTAAEQRGLTHAFLFWHGPLYPVGAHCCTAAKTDFVTMANKHPIISATFHGHEHQIAWVHIDKSRYSNATHEFEEFVTGSSGAEMKECKAHRSDYCQKAAGFATVDVSGKSFVVKFFLNGNSTPDRTFTFNKGDGGNTKPAFDHP
ncbi:MAG TPA: metallophosphoesterase [Acidobacteriota bacterium]|nr:metallophosphoesterase [Acidobacteriota bacterium]